MNCLQICTQSFVAHMHSHTYFGVKCEIMTVECCMQMKIATTITTAHNTQSLDCHSMYVCLRMNI